MALDFTKYTLKYRNVSNGNLIGNNYIFNGPVTPIISFFNNGVEIPTNTYTGFTPTYTLEKDGEIYTPETGAFNNTGVTLSEVGKYKLSTTLTDNSEGSNTKIFVLSFTIKVSYTPLESYNPAIINLQDFNSNTETYKIITNNSEIEGGTDPETGTVKGATPALNGSIPYDLEVSAYELTRNGLLINYDPDVDILSDPGTYTLVITVSRKNGYPASGGATSKKFTVTFKITQPPLDLSKVKIRVFNRIDNREISDNKVFSENNTINGDIQVIPFYDLPERVDSRYSLFYYENITSTSVLDVSKIEGVEFGDFELGSTILSFYGLYRLEITLIENQNEKNTHTFYRNFFIQRPQIDIQSGNIRFRNRKNDNIIADRDVFIASDLVQPLAYYDGLGIYGNEDIIKETVILTRQNFISNSLALDTSSDPVMVEGFINGETELNEVGYYTLTYTITDTIKEKLYSEYVPVKKVKEFIIKRSPVDLETATLSLKNNGDELINGYVYGPDEISKLTINSIYNCYTSIKCRIKNTAGEVKYKTLKTKDSDELLYTSLPIDQLYGEYLITIECRDIEFPSINYITKTYVITVLKEQFDPTAKIDPSIRLYLNGQLQPITSKQFTLCDLVGDIGNNVPRPGNYNLLVVNTNLDNETNKLINFNYTVKEYNFRVVPQSTSQNPYVAFDPPKGSGLKKSILKAYVKFPKYASNKVVALCKAGEKPSDVASNLWSALAETKGYIEVDPEKYGLTEATTTFIKVSYTDNTNGSVIIDDNEEDRIEAYLDFDTLPLRPEDILLGVVDGEKYFTVTPNVKRQYNYSYKAKLAGPSDSNTLTIDEEDPNQDFNLGSNIRNEDGGWYALQIYRTNNSTGKVKSFDNPVVFFIDSSVPDAPILYDNSTNKQLKTDVYPLPLTVKINNYNSDYSYRGYLNNRLILPVNGVFKITKKGNYKLSVIAEKIISSTGQLSGSKSSTVVNFLTDNTEISSSDPILSKRQPLIPISTDEVSKAYDGELIAIKNDLGKYNGEFGLYRDGLIINRLSELNEDISRLNEDIINLTIDAKNNISNSLSLDFLSSELLNKLEDCREATTETKLIVNKAYTDCQDLSVPVLKNMIDKDKEINNIIAKTKVNTASVNNLVKKFDGKINELKGLINSMQNNSNLIAEVKQLYTNYRSRL